MRTTLLFLRALSLAFVQSSHYHLLPTLNPKVEVRLGVYQYEEEYGQCDPAFKTSDFNEKVLDDVATSSGKVLKCIIINGGLIGALKSLEEKKIDLIARPMWPQSSVASVLYPIIQNDLCVLVRRNDPKRQTILKSFSNYVWGAILAVVVSFGIVAKLGGRTNPAMEVLRTFISGGFKEEPKRPVINFLFLLLSVFGMVLVAAFCGRFMSYLAVMGETKQPQTIQDVVDRVSRVYASQSTVRLSHRFSDDDVTTKLLRKTAIDFSKISALLDLTTQGDAAWIISWEMIQILLKNPLFMEPSGRSLLHLVPQCIRSPAYQSFVVRRSWFYRDTFDNHFQRAVEAGLRTFWRRRLYFQAATKGMSVPHADTKSSEGPKALGIEIMLEPTVVLGIGLTIAGMVFAFEHIAYRCRRFRTRIKKSRNTIT